MVDRCEPLFGLLEDERNPLARLVLADGSRRSSTASSSAVFPANTATRAGYSWAAIGKALGVSRAAAHERFSERDTRGSKPTPMSA